MKPKGGRKQIMTLLDVGIATYPQKFPLAEHKSYTSFLKHTLSGYF